MNNPEQPISPDQLARECLEYYLQEGSLPKMPEVLPPEYEARAGVFVSLKKDGQLRGCIGTVEPVRDNLAEEIAANAVSAAVRDPRFPAVSREEMEDITVSVDILGPMESVKSEKDLDPQNYGVLVCSGSHSGLLLPKLEGINTVEKQVEIARSKAAISPGEPVQLYRFKVTRYSEH